MNKKYILTWIFVVFCVIISFVTTNKRDEIKCYFNSSQNCLNLGNKYFELNQTQKAIEYFNKSCDLANLSACYNLGIINENGFGISKNKPKAMQFYKFACDNNFAKL